MFLFSILNNGADFAELILYILALLLAAMIAIVMHEMAHGYMALKCGDPTAKNAGRLTFNPLAHFDLIGVIMLLLVGFGWAKPVPVNPSNFKNYRKGTFLVSVAGVATNLILCGIGLLLIYILKPLILYTATATVTAVALRKLLYYFLVFFTKINFMLAFFNLLPIFPLDGFRVVNLLLKPGNAYSQFMYRYGSFALIGLILLSRVLNMVNLQFLDIFYWGNYLIGRLLGLVM
ncbi:MAG: site-2 protease family protein [Clostridiales bacterium]|nr:site-2 protease family protein [Clostridiales bacterium]